MGSTACFYSKTTGTKNIRPARMKRNISPKVEITGKATVNPCARAHELERYREDWLITICVSYVYPHFIMGIKMDTNSVKASLTPHELTILNSELEKHKKSTILSYVLLILFGTLGIHRIYIGEKSSGCKYLLLGFFGWIFIFIGVRILYIHGSMPEFYKLIIISHYLLFYCLYLWVSLFFSFDGLGITAIAGAAVLIWTIIGVRWVVDLFTLQGQIKEIYERKESIIIETKIIQKNGEK